MFFSLLRFSYIVLIMTFSLVTAPSASFGFEPGQYIVGSNNNLLLYLEGESLKSVTKGLESFYFSLRKGAKNKEIEWGFLVQWLNSKVGLDVFAVADTKKVGLDRRHKFALVLYKSFKRRGRNVQLIVPTLNSNKFYAWVKGYLNRKQKFGNLTPKSKELKKGSLLRISLKKKRFYLSKGKHHVSFSDSQRLATQGTLLQKEKLTETEKYKQFKASSKKTRGNVAHFFATAGIFSLLDSYSWLPAFKIKTHHTQTILKNTKLIHGEVSIRSSGVSLSMRHLLQKGFLKQGNKKMIDFQLDYFNENNEENTLQIGNLHLDRNRDDKILHLTGLFNPKHIWNYLPRVRFLNIAKLLPHRNPFNSYRNIFASSLRGDVSIVVMRLLPAGLSFDLHNTDFIASLGLQKGGQKQVKSKLEKFLKSKFTSYGLQLNKTKYRGKYDLWKLHWNEQIKKRVLSRILYVFFHGDQFSVFSKKESAAKLLNTHKDSIINQHSDILSSDEKNSSGMIFFDVEQIYLFVSKSSLGLLFPQYVGYIKRIKSLLLHSFQQDDMVSTELKVILK